MPCVSDGASRTTCGSAGLLTFMHNVGVRQRAPTGPRRNLASDISVYFNSWLRYSVLLTALIHLIFIVFRAGAVNVPCPSITQTPSPLKAIRRGEIHHHQTTTRCAGNLGNRPKLGLWKDLGIYIKEIHDHGRREYIRERSYRQKQEMRSGRWI